MSALSKGAADCLRSAEKIARGDLPPMETSERRLHKRHDFRRDLVSVWAGEGGSPHALVTMRSTNLSSGGMSLTARAMVYAGQRGVVRMCLPDRDPIIVGVEALHCRYAGEMRYVIGCRFHQLPEALSRLRFVEKDGEIKAVW